VRKEEILICTVQQKIESHLLMKFGPLVTKTLFFVLYKGPFSKSQKNSIQFYFKLLLKWAIK